MSQSKVPCGLINQGMTCYLNAVLQTLFMTVKYRNEVLSLEKDIDQSPEENILKALADLFRKLEDEKSAVHTKEVTDALNIPNVFEQQDAAEYLQMILHKTPGPSTVFRGTMETTTICSFCQHKYVAETDFLSIPMSVGNKEKDDVHEALSAYERVYEMNGKDQLYCVHCDSMKNMETENYIKELPDILTLQVKRFEMTFTQTGVDYWKNEYQVNFPSETKVYSLNYELYVIINHFGTYKCGHYDVLIKDESKNWFYFDDHNVKRVDYTTTDLIKHSCKSAYLLMYRSVPEESTEKDERPKEQNCRPQTETNEGRRRGEEERDRQRETAPGEQRRRGPKEHLETGEGERDKSEGNINRSDDTPKRTVQQALASAEQLGSPREISQKKKKTKKPEDEGTSSKDKKTEDMNYPPCPKSSMQEYSQVSACHLKTFKQRMKEKLKYLKEGTLNGERQRLKDIFIERNMKAKTSLYAADDKEIMCSKIFEGENIKIVLTKGDAGIGKTVSVQKFVLDWAEERTHTEFKYIFLMPFQKLNIISEKVKECSFRDLLQQCFDIRENLELCDSDKIMFILDGLNELKLPLTFKETTKIVDVSQSASVAVLLTNLIMRNLLPNSLIWITTRPGAASQIPERYLDRVTQLNGFTNEQKNNYFSGSISDPRMAIRFISHIKTSKRIYSMCHIPDYCRIIATMPETMLRTDHEEIPSTLTQMYATFLVAQTKINQESTPKKTNIISLGKVAFQLLVDGKSPIRAEDLKKIETFMKSSANIKTGVICQNKNKSFCFVNHRTQEFLAAIYVTEMINRKNNYERIGHVQEFSSLNLDPTYGDMCFTEYQLLQNFVDRALERQMEVFLFFLLGLSLESSRKILQGFLTQRKSSSSSKQAIIQNIKTMIQKSSPEKSICLFDCLMEVDECFLVQEIKTQLKYGVRLSPSEWSAHMFVLVNSEEQLDETERSNSHQLEKHSLKLRPVLKTSVEPEVYQCGISAKCCADLRSAMRSNFSHLTELDLSGNYLGDSGVKQLSALLKDSQCKLEKLWLSSCKITEESFTDLSSALRSNCSHLRELDLSDNFLDDSGMKLVSSLLSHCKLKRLSLRSCNITGEGCADLSSALRLNLLHLRELDLSDNVLRDTGVKHLSYILQDHQCKLQKLLLRSCYINEMDCADLCSALRSNLSHLRELDLSNNLFGDSGVKHLSAVLEQPQCKLQKLWLKSCHIGERGSAFLLKALESNPSHLTELDLSENYVCSSGLKDSSCRLVKIMLRSCNITEEGFTRLCSALRSNPSHLRELDLSDNFLDDSKVKNLTLLLKESLCKLKKLWLRKCFINVRGCADLSSALRSNPSHLTELDLSNNWFSDSGLKHISDLLEDCHCKVQKLWLRSCNITAEGCADLSSALRSNHSHLTELDLSYNYIRDSGLKHISDLLKDPQCKLETLWLRSCKITADGCADLSLALRSNPSHLTELDLSNNWFSDSGLKRISDLLEDCHCKVQKLWLRSCNITAEGCADLSSALRSNHSHLTELDLSDNYIRDSGLKHISDLLKDPQCKLETLWLYYIAVGIKQSAVLRSKLREMDMSYKNTRNLETKDFFDILPFKLEKLWLRSCNITAEGCADLSSALRSNHSHLTELDLSYNYIRDSGLKHISDLLKDPQCKLETLWLRSCNITADGCADLSLALRSNPSHLTELDLSNNWFSDSGLKRISDLLEDCHCKVQKLWLRSCNITAEGCADLSSTLRSNHSHLTELDLSDNYIRDSGLKHISDLLKDPQCKLETLWLNSCSSHIQTS